MNNNKALQSTINKFGAHNVLNQLKEEMGDSDEKAFMNEFHSSKSNMSMYYGWVDLAIREIPRVYGIW